MTKSYIEKTIIFSLLFISVILFLLPFILFGKYSIISIHDNLDSVIPWNKMFKENDLFLKFNTPTKGFSEMSSIYYSQIGFYFQNFFYMIFSDFTAYSFLYIISFCFSFISMYIMLKKTFGFSINISILSAICYAVLPVIPVWNIAISTLPLIISLFKYFVYNNSFSWKTIFLLFFPFFSFFATIGIFILAFWLLGFIVHWIKTKKININLLVGFIMLCIGYVIVDLRLFYVMFVLKTPLNRSVFNIHPTGIIAQLKVFMNNFKEYSLHGYYHASSFQRKIIVPFAFIVSVIYLIMMIRKIMNKTGKILTRIKNVIIESSFHEKMLFILEFTVVFFSVIAALYDSGLMDNIFKKYIPALSGFNWGRVWIFNRVLWYVIFALCLQFVLEIGEIIIKVNIRDNFEEIKISSIIPRLVVLILACSQLLYIFLTPEYYNDQIKTWINEIRNKRGITLRIIPNDNYDTYISYKEYFAVDLFEKIKKDIAYSDERVVAFGYHPSVLMYNGFNCIDGYNNAYPLSYMKKFRTLIAPELENNQKDREYYDSWGGRMYLYNSEMNFQPTRNKNTLPVKLNIDMEVFKNDFNGKYILSRAEISNNEYLGLRLRNIYYDENSIYTIYLYQTK